MRNPVQGYIQVGSFVVWMGEALYQYGNPIPMIEEGEVRKIIGRRGDHVIVDGKPGKAAIGWIEGSNFRLATDAEIQQEQVSN